MNALELAAEGSWTDAISIAALGFLSGAAAAVVLGSVGGGAAQHWRHPEPYQNDDYVQQQQAAIDRQNHAVLSAIVAFVCLNE